MHISKNIACERAVAVLLSWHVFCRRRQARRTMIEGSRSRKHWHGDELVALSNYFVFIYGNVFVVALVRRATRTVRFSVHMAMAYGARHDSSHGVV